MKENSFDHYDAFHQGLEPTDGRTEHIGNTLIETVEPLKVGSLKMVFVWKAVVNLRERYVLLQGAVSLTYGCGVKTRHSSLASPKLIRVGVTIEEMRCNLSKMEHR
jgi:hypothetical protein